MADQTQEQDRSEAATPFKLREAQRRGQVAKSLELNSLLILLVALGALYLWGEKFTNGMLRISERWFASAHLLQFDGHTPVQWFDEIVRTLVALFWPVLAGLIVIAALANLVQTGPIFSFFPLKPDVRRLNPVQGFKRLFSKKLLFESFKSILKILLFGVVLYYAIVGVLPQLVGLMDVHPDNYAAILLGESGGITFKLILAVLAVALLDIAFVRWDFAKQMRMSRRALREEVKRREGDPLIRAKLRALQKEAVKRTHSLGRVPQADVLITNPTHLAVALKYDRTSMTAPMTIAKGAGELALHMRARAREYGVPVVENKELARRLFGSADIDEPIPEELYPAVAQVLVRVMMKKNPPARAPT